MRLPMQEQRYCLRCFAKQNAFNKLIIALNVLTNYICFVNILIKNRYLMFLADSIAQLKEKVL